MVQLSLTEQRDPRKGAQFKVFQWLSLIASGALVLQSVMALSKMQSFSYEGIERRMSVEGIAPADEEADAPPPPAAVRSVWPAQLRWDNPVPSIKCRKTKFFPYMVGCPSSCAKYRTDVPPNAPMYRTELYWEYGLLDDSTRLRYNNETLWEGITDEALMELFPESSPDLARKYVDYEKTLIKRSPAELDVKTRKKIHVSLFYFCCLTASEVKLLRSTLNQWIESKTNAAAAAENSSAVNPFNVPMQFNRMECWQKGHDSISSVLIADAETQRKIYHGVYTEGINTLIRAGVPVVVRREEQMPFHVPIATFFAPGKRGDIGPYTSSVARLSNGLFKLGDTIIGTNTTSAPKLSSKMTCHANCPTQSSPSKKTSRS